LDGNTVGEICAFVLDVDLNETEFCSSTVPLYLCDIVHSGSSCIWRQPPEALPNGQPGLQPKNLEVALIWPAAVAASTVYTDKAASVLM
jgi:hypothetical protein